MLSIQHVMCGAMVMDPDAHEKEKMGSVFAVSQGLARYLIYDKIEDE